MDGFKPSFFILESTYKINRLIRMAGKLYKVIVPVTDLWKKPAFESSRVSQALFGEILKAQRYSRNHIFIQDADGYSGWVKAGHLMEFASKASGYAAAQIKTHLADVFLSKTGNRLLTRLSFGTEIEYNQKYSGRLHIPGIGGWISEKDLRSRKPGQASPGNIITTLKMFPGTPYLWGGKSAFGIDCSGLVWLVYAFHKISLPRDSKDQRKCGQKVSMKNMKPGDLVFSPGHVAVYLGGGKIIHSSLKAGGVKVESLEKSSVLYRPDIAENILEARRVL